MAATALILGAIAATGGIAVLAGGSALVGIIQDGRGRGGRYEYRRYKGYGEEKDDEKKKKEEEEKEKRRRKKKQKELKQGKGPGGFSLRHSRSAPAGGAGGDASATEQFLQGVGREDAAGCGLRLLCEMAAAEAEAEASGKDLGEEELVLLSLLGPVAKPGEGLLPPNEGRLPPDAGLVDTRAVVRLGLRKGACAEAYSLCPPDAAQILRAGAAFLP